VKNSESQSSQSFNNVSSKRIASVLAGLGLALLISACEEEVKPPEVNWQNKSPDVTARVNSKVDTRDCAGLQEELNSLVDQIGPGGTPDEELFAYISYKQSEMGCQN
jgi:hypothetical protein